MIRYNQDGADCFVYTHKEGILSSLAHELKIRVSRFSILVNPETLEILANFDPSSLEVVCAMDGGLEGGELAKWEVKEIERSIKNSVLKVSRYNELTFRSTSVKKEEGNYYIVGNLTLFKETKIIGTVTRLIGDKIVAQVEINQPDFGIKPFKKVLGSLLKVGPIVKVVVSVPIVEI